jgi:shikimate kinase
MSSSVVYLVGFMGAGKSAVGECLAEMLRWSFFDLDREIEKRAAMTIPEIFRYYGEARFRTLETEELERMSGLTDAVVALGGGAFCSPEIREIVARTGVSVWLDAPLELLFERCRVEAAARPLFTTREEMAGLLERRRPSYAESAHHVMVAGKSADEIAREICSLI